MDGLKDVATEIKNKICIVYSIEIYDVMMFFHIRFRRIVYSPFWFEMIQKTSMSCKNIHLYVLLSWSRFFSLVIVVKRFQYSDDSALINTCHKTSIILPSSWSLFIIDFHNSLSPPWRFFVFVYVFVHVLDFNFVLVFVVVTVIVIVFVFVLVFV